MPTKLENIQGQFRHKTTVTLNGVTTTNESSDTVSTVLPQISSGVPNPKWKDQVRKHQNATTPYSCDKHKLRLTPGSSDIAYEVFPGFTLSYQLSGRLLQSIGAPAVGGSSGLSDAVYLEFVREAQKHLRSVQGMTALGELREAIHAIRHPMESLRKGMSDYLAILPYRASRRQRLEVGRLNRQAQRPKRPRLGRDIDRNLSERGVIHVRQGPRPRKPKKPPSRADILQDVISGTYLEYANGWRPFISEIKATSKALAEHFTPSGVGYRKVNAKVSGDTSTTITESIGSVGYAFAWDQLEVTVKESSARMVGEVVVSSSGSSEDLLRNAGFSLAGFGPTLWDLLPLSYVGDWFSNMGNVLEAIAFNRAHVAWWCRTVKAKSETTWSGRIRPPSPGTKYTSYSGNPGGAVWTRTAVIRDDASVWMPSLAFSLPGSHLISKLANASSLLAQARSTSKQLSRFLNG